MTTDSVQPTPLEKPVAPALKHSGLGIASFIIAIIAGVTLFFSFAVAGFLQVSRPGGLDEKSGLAMLVGLFIIAVCMVHLVGLGLGIAGVFQAGRRKVFSVLGLVLNAGAILGTIGLIVVGNMMK
jgi:hypothetical protein